MSTPLTTDPVSPGLQAEPSQAEAPQDGAAKSPRTTLTAKRIKRRMDKIGASSEPRNLRRKRAKFAQTVLGQIASGQIRNPKAAASAFAAAQAEQDAAIEAAKPEAGADDAA